VNSAFWAVIAFTLELPVALKISVLTVGDELINGEMADTNTACIARVLASHGFELRDSQSVGDVEADIEEAILGFCARRDVVIVTGGLGPTGDDLTARAAARALGRRLILHEEALTLIRDYFSRISLPMHPRNEKQALLPQKATVLPNSCGTAPGFSLHQSGCDLFFLPGVPLEMEAMLRESVLPRLLERSGNLYPGRERVFKIFGLHEPKVEEIVAASALPEGVEIAFGVDFPLVHLKLRARGYEADHLLDQADIVVRRALSDHIVAVGEETLAGNVARLLSASGLTLSVAESCTGGLICARLTEIPGSSAFLERGAVTYANAAKADWLGVPAAVLETEGAVSEKCALAMAQGMRRAAGTDIALSVTGIAGPAGGTPEKPVGTVFFALAGPGSEQVKGYRFQGDRERIRTMAVCMGLEWLRRYLVRQNPESRIQNPESRIQE
jgi:nicotinamide-nucleotide amidase